MSNFTKGPWAWSADRLVSLANDQWVASPEYDNNSGWAYIEISDEDRNLIAAAPDLYEMLSIARHAAMDDYACGEDLIERIDSALAKARGET